MKRTIVLSVLAALLPIAVAAQVEPPPVATSAPKYEVYLGVAYSRLRQAPVSYSGLVGGKASLARDFGKYFQLAGSIDYYRVGTGHGYIPDRGDPSIYSFLVAPTFHMTIYGPVSGELFPELGFEHTGGMNMNPDTSFAGGFGGGLAYSLSSRWAVKLSGERVGASFSLPNNTSQLSYSSNRTWNTRGTIGIAYRF